MAPKGGNQGRRGPPPGDVCADQKCNNKTGNPASDRPSLCADCQKLRTAKKELSGAQARRAVQAGAAKQKAVKKAAHVLNETIICTVIYNDDDGALTKERFSDEISATAFIVECVRKVGKIDVVTDLHKTLDTIDKDIMLVGPSVILSFVGSSGTTFDDAEADSRARMESGQAKLALLVHRRGKGYVATNEPGSKAWAVGVVYDALLEGGNASASAAATAADVDLHFFDDADDHVDSVQKYTKAKAHKFDPEGRVTFNDFVAAEMSAAA